MPAIMAIVAGMARSYNKTNLTINEKRDFIYVWHCRRSSKT
jgi:hypothetical protein